MGLATQNKVNVYTQLALTGRAPPALLLKRLSFQVNRLQDTVSAVVNGGESPPCMFSKIF